MKKNIGIVLILFLIIALGGVLRFYNLGQHPPGFFLDEASVGYNAYTIAKGGVDEWGQTWPVYFKAFGEYKNPVYIYLTALSVKLFGLTEWAVRWPNALLSTLSIVLIYWLGWLLTKRFDVALIASGLLAVLPWHVHLSRPGMDGTVYCLFFLLLAINLMITALERKNLIWWWLAIIGFGVTFYTYTIMRLYVPLGFVFGLMTLWYYHRLSRKQIVLSLCLFLIMVLPYSWANVIYPLNQRFYEVTILSEPWFIVKIILSYIQHWLPWFLFSGGDFNPRHSVPGVGLIYLAMLMPLVLGIFALLKTVQNHDPKIIKALQPYQAGFLLGWLMLYPLASILTKNSPHALRAMVGIPVLVIISAIGYKVIWDIIPKKKFVMILLGSLLVLEVVHFNYQYFIVYKNNQAVSSWQYGYAQVYDYIDQVGNNYQQIEFSRLITLNSYIFSRFYLPDRPDLYNKISYDYNGKKTLPNDDTLYILTGWDLEFWDDQGIKYEVLETISEYRGIEFLYITKLK